MEQGCEKLEFSAELSPATDRLPNSQQAQKRAKRVETSFRREAKALESQPSRVIC